jgi:hypothetical protein
VVGSEQEDLGARGNLKVGTGDELGYEDRRTLGAKYGEGFDGKHQP